MKSTEIELVSRSVVSVRPGDCYMSMGRYMEGCKQQSGLKAWPIFWLELGLAVESGSGCGFIFVTGILYCMDKFFSMACTDCMCLP